MASALREIADNADPLFEVVDASVRPNGLAIERLRVPLGVIGVVYENRPNVTSDVAGLCVRSGNAAYLGPNGPWGRYTSVAVRKYFGYRGSSPQ